jgi:outer membrane protein assembly factor BamA
LAAEKAEKEAKLAAEKAEKEAKLAAEKEAKKKDTPKKKKAVVEAVVEEDEPDVVKKIEFEGKKYLKSKKTGIIYDYTEYVKNGEQVVVGKWNETKNKIDFTETSEESEEEYEE